MELHSKKIFYSMGEVSEMLDVKPSLIRFWEKRFDIIKPHKNKKGNRMFTPGDVENLKLIYHLVREKGMTLAGAEQVLKKGRDGAVRDTELVTRLLAMRSLLEEIRQELHPGWDGTTIVVTDDAPVAIEPQVEPQSQNEPEGPADDLDERMPEPMSAPRDIPETANRTLATKRRPEAEKEPDPAPVTEPEPAPAPAPKPGPEPGREPAPEPVHDPRQVPEPLPRIVEQTLF